MTHIDSSIIDGLNIALNEATIIGLHPDIKERVVQMNIKPVAIQSDGIIPISNTIFLRGVGRIAASYKLNNDDKAMIFSPRQLSEKMKEFYNEQIYGWEFINNGQDIFDDWKDNLSFDLIFDENLETALHTIDLFQEDKFSKKNIDIRIWFKEIRIYDANLDELSIQVFVENGERGWQKLYKSGWTT